MEDKVITFYDNHSTLGEKDYSIKIIIDYCNNPSTKNLKLVSRISTTNMTLFDTNNKIKTYKGPKEIITEFYDARIKAYERRKEKTLKLWKDDSEYITLKYKFVYEVVVEKTIELRNATKKDLIPIMQEKKYPVEFLTSIHIHSLTEEGLEKLLKEKEKILENIKTYEQKSIYNIYLEELEELEKALAKYE